MGKSFVETVKERHNAMQDPEIHRMMTQTAIAEVLVKHSALQATVEVRAETRVKELDADMRSGRLVSEAVAKYMARCAVSDRASSMGRTASGDMVKAPQGAKVAEDTEVTSASVA